MLVPSEVGQEESVYAFFPLASVALLAIFHIPWLVEVSSDTLS